MKTKVDYVETIYAKQNSNITTITAFQAFTQACDEFCGVKHGFDI